MKFNIVIALAYMISFSVYSQNIDSVNALKADELIDQFFEKELIDSDYLLYNIGDMYLVVIDKKSKYHAYKIDRIKGTKREFDIRKKHKLIRRAFDSESCSKHKTYSKSDSISQYKHQHTRYVHYYLNKKGNKECEFSLPILFNTNVSKVQVYPLDERVQKYLTKKLLSIDPPD